MNSHLDRIDDWPSLARAAHYRSEELASLADFSLRQLERYFAERFGKPPRAWLKELRLQEENFRLQAALKRLSVASSRARAPRR